MGQPLSRNDWDLSAGALSSLCRQLVGDVPMCRQNIPCNSGEFGSSGRNSHMGDQDYSLKNAEAATSAATDSTAFPLPAAVDPHEGLRSAHVACGIQHHGVRYRERLSCNLPEIWQACHIPWLQALGDPLQGRIR